MYAPKLVYIPIEHHRRRRYIGREDEPKSKNSLLTAHDAKSLVVTALIFLSIFAWVDVLALAYKNYYLSHHLPHMAENRVAGIIPPDIVHRMPKTQLAREHLEGLDVRAKAGYAVLLSLGTIIAWVVLSRI